MAKAGDEVEPDTISVLFQTGFRAFFFAAALFVVVSMIIWMAQLIFSVPILPVVSSASFWHAHEMIYGYGLAVIAGFLLTAVRNWTGMPTLSGRPLQGLLLLLLWLLARLAPFFSSQLALVVGAVCDALFIIVLSIAITLPVVKTKLWKNMGVIATVYMFLPGQLLYGLDQFGLFADGRRIGLYIGFYMVLLLILVLSRRVMPMFIERGVKAEAALPNYKWLDLSSLLLFLIFVTLELFFYLPMLTASVAAVLALLHLFRLWGWHHRGVWNKPLLWMLYLAYAWMIIGFGLKSATAIAAVSPFLAVHAFAVGGMGMMSRISLGHTGRNIMQPPANLGLMFMLLFSGASVRVFCPLIFNDLELLWVALSQCFWVSAYLLFLYSYAFILKSPRIDGKSG